MSDEEEKPEIEVLEAQISQLKEVLDGVKSAETGHDDGCAKIASYVASQSGKDGFLVADPGTAQVNAYHTKPVGGVGAGGDDGGCCTAM